MKKFIKHGAYIAAALVTLFSLGAAQVIAQNNTQGNGFRISPVRSEFTIDKGKKDTLTITIENPSGAATVAHPVVNDFVASDDESGEPRLILDDKAPLPKNDFKKLVGDLPDVNLGPKEKKDIAVTIAVPDGANAGGYYGAIRFIPQLTEENDKTNVGLTASVGTIVLVRVPGNLTEKLDLVQLSAASKSKVKDVDVYKARSFFTSGNVAIMTRLKNSGDIHVQPYGKVTVKDMFGKTVQTLEFNNTQPRANILPDSIRKFTDDLDKHRWFGRYTVDINLGYTQGGGDIISSRSTFWYIPTVVLYGLILLILAIVGGIYWFIRRQKARKQHKHDVNKKKNYTE